jgi:hypothetical protein
VESARGVIFVREREERVRVAERYRHPFFLALKRGLLFQENARSGGGRA